MTRNSQYVTCLPSQDSDYDDETELQYGNFLVPLKFHEEQHKHNDGQMISSRRMSTYSQVGSQTGDSLDDHFGYFSFALHVSRDLLDPFLWGNSFQLTNKVSTLNVSSLKGIGMRTLACQLCF
jgi:hypothetical protein